MAATMGALTWDVRQIMAAMRPSDEDVLYIGDTEPVCEQFATRKFDFRLRG